MSTGVVEGAPAALEQHPISQTGADLAADGFAVSGMRSGGQVAFALDRFATVVRDEAWTELDAC